MSSDPIPTEIESFLSAAPRAPPARSDCLYLEKGQRWCPLGLSLDLSEESKKSARKVRFVLQRAPSAMARCRVCGDKIDKQEVRLGFPLSDSRGEFGVLTAWVHFKCSSTVVQAAAEEFFAPEELLLLREKALAAKVEGIHEGQQVSSATAVLKASAKTTVKPEPSLTDCDLTSGADSSSNPVTVAQKPDTENTKSVSAQSDAVSTVISLPVKTEISVLSKVLDTLLPVLESFFAHWEILDAKAQEELAEYALGLQAPKREDGCHLLEETVHRKITAREPAPEDMVVPLLPFQEEGLAWMCQQEESPVKGGILADEMGMGKTIQTIALLLKRKLKAAGCADTPSGARAIDPQLTGATLVVAPLAAVMQWKQEIERFSKPDALRVLIYHGACRVALLPLLHTYDVVLTTYATIEADYRQVLNTHKIACKFCGRLFLPDKLTLHLRYFCGDEATRTARQAKTERKQRHAAEKAMRTLNIDTTQDLNDSGRKFNAKMQDPTTAFPTISNVYRAIMQEAHRDNELQEPTSKIPWIHVRPRHVKREQKRSLEEAEAAVSTGSTQKRRRIQTATSMADEEHYSNAHEKTEDFKDTSENGRGPSTISRADALNLRLRLGISKTTIQKKKVAELQHILREIGAQTFGTKVELVNRLTLLLFPDEWQQDASDDEVPPSLQSASDSDEETHSPSVNGRTQNVAGLKKTRGLSNTKKTSSVGKFEKTKTRTSHRPPTQAALIDSSVTGKPKSSDQHNAHGNTPDAKLPLAGRRPIRLCRLRNGMKPAVADASKIKETSSPSVVASSSSSASDGSQDSESDVSSFSFTEEQDGEGVASEAEWSSFSDSSLLASPLLLKRKSKKLTSNKKAKKTTTSFKPEMRTASDAQVSVDPLPVETEVSDSEADDGLDVSLSQLHVMRWRRIVLDEAHRIKGRTTSTAKAIYALKATDARWCLTGTPLQNRVGELYSLIRFLRLDPHAYYFCSKKGCSCRMLHYRFLNERQCARCGHSKLSHYSSFNRAIVTPIKNYGFEHQGRAALKTLKEQVLDVALLRRTKKERAEDVKLPPLTVLIRRDRLIPAERDFYESLYKQTRTQFNTYVDQGTVLHNYAHIFDLLSRLRQAVDHPYLIVYGNLAPAGGALNSQTFGAGVPVAEIPAPSRGNADVCWVCHEDVEDEEELAVSGCGHTFHRECLQQYISAAPDGSIGQPSKLGCPKCYAPLTVDLNVTAAPRKARVETDEEGSAPADRETMEGGQEGVLPRIPRSGILSRIRLAEFQSSTKIEALVQELESVATTDPAAKSIIFSQYTAMLDLIEWRLKKGGIHCAKLTKMLGDTKTLPTLRTLRDFYRDNILRAFNTDSELKVVLISLKAGGEGLNLQVANNIFLMDPWWNPATEMQAIQRAHRIGQTKPVRAVRFICEDTIEEKMLQLQEKKQLVFDGTVGASDNAMAKLTAEDLRFLFQN